MSSARSWFAARGFVRARRGRWLAGVAAGLSRRFGVPVSAVRIAWVLSVVLPGPQVLLYVALWILMPREPAEPAAGPRATASP